MGETVAGVAAILSLDVVAGKGESTVDAEVREAEEVVAEGGVCRFVSEYVGLLAPEGGMLAVLAVGVGTGAAAGLSVF